MIGTSLLVVVLLLTLAAIFFNKSSEGYKLDKKVAYSVYLATLVTIVTAAYLIYLFLSDQFQYVYVWSYSSQNLDVVYKITGLWAGQQGSFLLWLMIHAVVGSIIVWRKSMNKASFNTYLVLQAMLLVLLFYKNPFEIAQTVLQDGAGLNPLLQNFWMVSHPPLLFMGYAMLAVPFSYAMGALMSGDYNSWLQKSRTFTLAAWAFLASGIFLGAYWAYDTLGWGGYWGWDPVENSSLVPWLLATVLLHFQFGSSFNRGMFKPMISASLFCYVFVVYGAFLTRSGVLGDFSVHSFSGGDIGLILAAVVALLAMISFLVLGYKWQDIPVGEIYNDVSSPNFMLVAAMLIIVVMAILVTFGMSLPFLSGLIGKGQSVMSAFYNKTTGPLFVVLLGILIAYYVKARKISLPSALIHGGLIVMAVGIFVTGFGTTSENETFKVDEPVQFANETIVYKGITYDDQGKKHVFEVNGQPVEALTKLNDHGLDAAKAPGILHTLAGDLYFAPAIESDPAPEITLKRGSMKMENGILMAYEKAGFSTMEETGSQVVQAVLKVTDGTDTDEVTLSIAEENGSFKALPVTTLNNRFRMELHAITGDFSEIKVTAVDLEKEKVAPIQAEISWKPLIWLVWTGAILLVLGGVCRLIQYKRG